MKEHVKYFGIGSLLISLTFAFPSSSSPSNDGGKAHSKEEAGTSPGEALAMLRAGNERFLEGKAKHPKQDQITRTELTKGQKPHTIVLSCSDSRVGPELIFDQGLGQIFSVRSAGQFLEPGGLASIEYALEHLGTRHIVVLGHESCGAVKAAIATPPGGDTGSPNLNQLVWGIQVNLREQKCTPDPEDKKVREPVKANVQAIGEQLVHESHIIEDCVESKGAVITLGVYSLETGKVDFWDMPRMATLQTSVTSSQHK